MSSPTPNWTAVVERLEKLERQNRRLKQAGAVALILAAAVLLMGQVPSHRTVEANEFVLKDGDGRMRARLYMQAPRMVSPALEFYDLDGVKRVSLDVQYSGSGISFYDEEGTQEITLGQTLNSALGLYIGKPHIAGKENVDFASLEVNPTGSELSLFARQGTTRLKMHDQNGEDRLWLAVNPTLGPTLSLYSASGRSGPLRDGLAIDLNETGLAIFDNEGFATRIGATDLVTPRTGETHKTSAASVVLFDKDKNVLWKAP